MTTTLPVSFVRRYLGDILNRALKSRERFVITKRGKPVAMILDVEEYEKPSSKKQ